LTVATRSARSAAEDSKFSLFVIGLLLLIHLCSTTSKLFYTPRLKTK